MGYTTDFYGRFTLDRILTPEHRAYLSDFAETRRMKRDAEIASTLEDPVRLEVGLPIGLDGCYFVGGIGNYGQDRDSSILDYNREPSGQPGLWCQWVPNKDGSAIKWDRGEKFYNYVEWLQYLIDHFIKPWGYALAGEVTWQGEDPEDRGVISVEDNVVTPQIKKM